MFAQTNRQWLLAKRPRGALAGDELALTSGKFPEPAAGEILVRNLCLACEPTQLGWMAGDTYLPAVPIGDVMRSLAAGEVVASRHPAFAAGDRVQGLFGFQEYCVIQPEAGPYPVMKLPADLDVEIALAVLGSTGLTAYFGLHDVGKLAPGETVVVSAAAGATGSIAGQLAKVMGCRVVGIAGGPDKCSYLVDELGFDAAIDYKHENVLTRLRATCPKGVDVYFDNVGGRILDAVLLFLALRGRIVLCGAISGYTENVPPPGPRNYIRLVQRRGRMEGFIVLDYMERAAEASAVLERHLREGRLKARVDVAHGIESAPHALQKLFTGENRGKQLVKLAY